MNAELPKFSDSPVEIFHSLLRRNTEKHLTANQIIKEARYSILTIYDLMMMDLKKISFTIQLGQSINFLRGTLQF